MKTLFSTSTDSGLSTDGRFARTNIRLALYPVVQNLIKEGYDRREIDTLLRQTAAIALLDVDNITGFKP